MKTYLREIKCLREKGANTVLEIFEGDIKKDKEYQKEHNAVSLRYFELKEIK